MDSNGWRIIVNDGCWWWMIGVVDDDDDDWWMDDGLFSDKPIWLKPKSQTSNYENKSLSYGSFWEGYQSFEVISGESWPNYGLNFWGFHRISNQQYDHNGGVLGLGKPPKISGRFLQGNKLWKTHLAKFGPQKLPVDEGNPPFLGFLGPEVFNGFHIRNYPRATFRKK